MESNSGVRGFPHTKGQILSMEDIVYVWENRILRWRWVAKGANGLIKNKKKGMWLDGEGNTLH